MRKRVKQAKHPKAMNQIAAPLAEIPSRNIPPIVQLPFDLSEYMATIGRKGGRIGGKRRMQTMTAEERSKIAKKAARIRWKKFK